MNTSIIEQIASNTERVSFEKEIIISNDYTVYNLGCGQVTIPVGEFYLYSLFDDESVYVLDFVN